MGAYAGVHAEGDMDMARAWPRFWAKNVDIVIYAVVAGGALGLVFPATFVALSEQPGGMLLVSMLLLPFALVIDAIVLAATGGSPGKWLAGLRLETMEGEKVGMDTALKRNLLLWVRGLWLGIPLLILVGYIKSYNDVQASGRTQWDDATETRVADRHGGEFRTILVAAAAIVLRVADQALARM